MFSLIPLTALTAHITFDVVSAVLKSTTNLILVTKNSSQTSSSSQRITDVMDEKDIVCKLRVIQSLLLETKENRWIRDRPSVKIARENLHDAVVQLETFIQSMTDIIKDHNQKYCASWRTPYIEENLTGISKWSDRLNDRLVVFREVVSVASATQPNKDE